jgi:type I restriction enzyme S subunit
MRNKIKTTAEEEQVRPALVPKLRFPEFRGAEGWSQIPMGEVYSFKGNNTLSRDKLNYVAGSVKNIHYGDIHTKYACHFDITKELVPFINESEEGVVVRDGNLCAAGDMVFADASEDMADIGKSIEIVRLSGESVVSGLHTILARPTGVRVALGFGGHLFKSEWVRTQIQKEAQGAKVLGISANRMRNLRLPLPFSITEQQKIAECLSSVDELIAAQVRKVDALKTHKKGLMQQLFPREGETQPRLRYPEFQDAGEWDDAPMGTLLMSSPDYGVNAAAVPFSDQLPKYLRITDISADGRYLPEKQVSVNLEATDGNYLDEGDIVLARTGASVGKSYQYRKEDGRLVFAGFLIRVKPHPNKLDSSYLANFLATGQYWKWVAVNSARSGQPGINSTEYSSLTIPLPPTRPEQQRIASCLSSLDALITAETQKLEALKTHKNGLMQQLFPSSEEYER